MAKKANKVPRPQGVLSRYLAGGEWKSKIFAKKGKRSFTTSQVATIRIALPPPEGWPGGDPKKNGF